MKQKVSRFFTLEKINSEYNYDGPLGPAIEDDHLVFRLWSPSATKVQVKLFSIDRKSELKSYQLLKKEKGLFEIKIPLLNNDDPHLLNYRYLVTNDKNQENMVLDPFAKSLWQGEKKEEAFNVVINLKKIPFPENNFFNNLTFIGQEISIRDYTIDPSSLVEKNLRGTFIGLIEKLDHFKNLGVTHLQLMPVMAFGSNNKLMRDFQGADVLIKNLNYNWGYDPQHFFSLDSWFSTDPDNAATKMAEFSKLVDKIHQKKMGVILDVVYNHVDQYQMFENLAEGAYIRRDENGFISFKSGAGASFESRSFIGRRLIIESLKFYRDFFKVDGFRFDLMGFIDQETMIEIRKALGPNVILYGEGWEFTDLSDDQKTTKSTYPEIGLSLFNDTSRDSYAGEMMSGGFVQGAGPITNQNNAKVRAGIIGSIANYQTDYNRDGFDDVNLSKDPYHVFAKSPLDTIQYLAIHDGFTLWDKINLSTAGDLEYKKKILKQALVMLFTSQGKILLDGGVELLRSKPLVSNDPEKSRAHTSKLVLAENGVKYFHENSYKSPDQTNRIDWNKLKTHPDVLSFLMDLIKFRKNFSEFQIPTGAEINRRLKFLDPYHQKKVDNSITFYDFKKIKIKFINGPVNGNYYLAGEVHPGADKNPKNNSYQVQFMEGEGSLEFDQAKIKNFDLKSWSDPHNLQIKLVKDKASWDIIPGSYSPMGNNRISPQSLDAEGLVVINLAIMDHFPGEYEQPEKSVISYKITGENGYDLYVFHNAEDRPLPIPNSILGPEAKIKIFILGEEISLLGKIDPAKIFSSQNEAWTPAHSSLVFTLSKP